MAIFSIKGAIEKYQKSPKANEFFILSFPHLFIFEAVIQSLS
jgi:hypothetical protein